MGTADFANQTVRVQQCQLAREGTGLATFFWFGGSVGVKQASRIAITESLQSELTPADGFQQSSVLSRPGSKRLLALARDGHRPTDREGLVFQTR